MLSKIIKRLDDWGQLTLLESFIRRVEIQSVLRCMIHDLKILASQLQVRVFLSIPSGPETDLPKLITGPELHTSPAEMTHLDIQDSLEMKGILRYIAGRPEELKLLTESSSPSDCQNFAKALQMARLFYFPPPSHWSG
jgi:hypothetical protein